MCLEKERIVYQSSCVGTPEQNTIVENRNRNLLEVAWSLLFTTQDPKSFWGKAVLTATYFINRMSRLVLDFQASYQVMLNYSPPTQLLSTLPIKVFSCLAFVHIHNHHKRKLYPVQIKCNFCWVFIKPIVI